MAVTAYLAGPDVFLPDALAHAARKVAICARYGIDGLAPLDEDTDSPRAVATAPAWRAIFDKNLATMRAADAVIAHLTPFRGPSADAGTLVEIGWFLGHGKPVFGYSNTAVRFAARSRRHVAAVADPVDGLLVEDFGLPDNLMVPGALLAGGGWPMVLPPDGVDRPFDALDVFERCVAIAAWKLGLRPAPGWAKAA